MHFLEHFDLQVPLRPHEDGETFTHAFPELQGDLGGVHAVEAFAT